LLRYISRVDDGYTVPAIETLEKMARALEVPMYQLFYDSEEPPKLPHLPKRKSSDDIGWGGSGKDARFLSKLRRLVGKAEDADRKLLRSCCIWRISWPSQRMVEHEQATNSVERGLMAIALG